MHPLNNIENSGDGASIPCPFCGCRHHIEETITGSPGMHATHRCLRCGRRIEDMEQVCPRCGSPGELLGDVDAPGHGLYAQYRCCGCSHGFMVRMNGGEEIRKT